MLDPLTALGVAGNILQFIDFTIKLVGEGNHIYHATNGALEQNTDAESLANDLAKLTQSFSRSQREWLKARGQTQLDADEVRLRNISERCAEIAGELNIQLQKLKVQDGSKYRRLKSYKQALLSVWRTFAVHAANDGEVGDLLKPILEQSIKLKKVQEERHSSEISRFIHEGFEQNPPPGIEKRP